MTPSTSCIKPAPADASSLLEHSKSVEQRHVHVRLQWGKPAGVFRSDADAKLATERAASVPSGRWHVVSDHGGRKHALVATVVRGRWPDKTRVYVLTDNRGAFKSVHGSPFTHRRQITDQFRCFGIQESAAASA